MAYFPGAAHVAASYRKLRDLAVESEARGDLAASLFAWRAVRSAALGTRFWIAPRDRERQIADANIARLSAAVRQALVPRQESGRGPRDRDLSSAGAGGGVESAAERRFWPAGPRGSHSVAGCARSPRRKGVGRWGEPLDPRSEAGGAACGRWARGVVRRFVRGVTVGTPHQTCP